MMRQTSVVRLTPREARICEEHSELLSQRGWPDRITYQGKRLALHQFVIDADDGTLQAVRYWDMEEELIVEVAD
jgi:hypothetical protein